MDNWYGRFKKYNVLGLVALIIVGLIIGISVLRSKSSPQNGASSLAHNEYVIVNVLPQNAQAQSDKEKITIPNTTSTKIYINLAAGKKITPFSSLQNGQVVSIEKNNSELSVTILKTLTPHPVNISAIQTKSLVPNHTVTISNPDALKKSFTRWQAINTNPPAESIEIILVDKPQATPFVKANNIVVISTSSQIQNNVLTVYFYIDPSYMKRESPQVLNQLVTIGVYSKIFSTLDVIASPTEIYKKVNLLIQKDQSLITVI